MLGRTAGVFLFLFSTPALWAQSYHFQNYSVEHGLVQSTVLATLQHPGRHGRQRGGSQAQGDRAGRQARRFERLFERPVMAEYWEHGFCDVLPKPFDAGALGALVVRVLQ